MAATITETLNSQYSFMVREKVGPYDNYFKATPFYDAIMSSGNKLPAIGKEQVDVIFEYTYNPNSGSIGENGEVSIASVDPYQGAYVDWRTVYVALPISHRKMHMSLESDFFGYVEALVSNSKKSIRAELARQLYLDGTGNSGLDMPGIASVISTDPTTGTIYNVLDRSLAANAWARNKYRTSCGSVATYGEQYLNDINIQCSNGSIVPDTLYTDKTTFGYLRRSGLAYEASARGEGGTLNVGYTGYRVFGMDVVADDNCPSGYIYCLNMKNSWKLQPLKGEEFVIYDFTDEPRKQTSIWRMYLTAVTYCTMPYANGITSGWTA